MRKNNAVHKGNNLLPYPVIVSASAEKNFGFKRLMKAFPDMTSREQNESLEKYKKYFNIRKPDHKKDEQENIY